MSKMWNTLSISIKQARSIWFTSMWKLERVLIVKCTLFKKITVLPLGQVEKITVTIYNVSKDNTELAIY